MINEKTDTRNFTDGNALYYTDVVQTFRITKQFKVWPIYCSKLVLRQLIKR